MPFCAISRESRKYTILNAPILLAPMTPTPQKELRQKNSHSAGESVKPPLTILKSNR
jgi:hypothetical protein